MSKGSGKRKEDTSKVRANWGGAFDKKESCPACGSEEYDTYHLNPSVGDSSITYSICCQCQHEFNGKPHWE